ncbi:hypothetical protein AMTR_s00071p00108520, partial [Amborella trichopoda]
MEVGWYHMFFHEIFLLGLCADSGESFPYTIDLMHRSPSICSGLWTAYLLNKVFTVDHFQIRGVQISNHVPKVFRSYDVPFPLQSNCHDSFRNMLDSSIRASHASVHNEPYARAGIVIYVIQREKALKNGVTCSLLGLVEGSSYNLSLVDIRFIADEDIFKLDGSCKGSL